MTGLKKKKLKNSKPEKKPISRIELNEQSKLIEHEWQTEFIQFYSPRFHPAFKKPMLKNFAKFSNNSQRVDHAQVTICHETKLNDSIFICEPPLVLKHQITKLKTYEDTTKLSINELLSRLKNSDTRTNKNKIYEQQNSNEFTDHFNASTKLDISLFCLKSLKHLFWLKHPLAASVNENKLVQVIGLFSTEKELLRPRSNSEKQQIENVFKKWKTADSRKSFESTKELGNFQSLTKKVIQSLKNEKKSVSDTELIMPAIIESPATKPDFKLQRKKLLASKEFTKQDLRELVDSISMKKFIYLK